MTAIRRGALKGVLVGFLVGLVFPVLAWIVAGGGSAVVIRQDQPVTWLVDAVPFCLAVIGGFLGAGYARFVQLQTDTASIAERIVDEWTEEIHNSNVEIARSADSQARFFAALSHDMRTPLSAIIGFSSLVIEDEVEESLTLQEVATDIRSCAGQLLEIVNDLLDAAKLEAGKIELTVCDLAGDEVLAKVVDHLSPLAAEKGLALGFQTGDTGIWRADPVRVRQILVNLISNAIKYTERGGIEVTSYTKGPHVFVDVVDTGAGIADEDLAAVFTPFEQTAVAQRRTDSTGLGLPISLGLAQAMDGTIEFHSAGPGRGSTFTLSLPLGTGAATEARVATLPAAVAA